MKEKKILACINILKKIVGVYFDTFFVLYFFQIANYEVLPLAKYYLTLYIFIGIGFFIIRNPMKKGGKVPYFRIGIALQAVYISLILFLKTDIIHHIYLVAIVKGFADGFYHFPKNIIDTEKITNEGRQKFNGFISTISKIISIIMPLILGILLSFFTYVEIGKIVFILFIIMFILSFFMKDIDYCRDKKFELKKFFKTVRNNVSLKNALMAPFFRGLTYSSGVMSLVITLSKINNFHTNLNLGFVDSLCSFLGLLTCILYTVKVKQKHFSKTIMISGIMFSLSLVLFIINPSREFLILYLILRYSAVEIISLITDYTLSNLSNNEVIKRDFKAEYFFSIDLLYAISRTLGYFTLFMVCIFFGMEFINYVLILCVVGVIGEITVINKLNRKEI